MGASSKLMLRRRELRCELRRWEKSAVVVCIDRRASSVDFRAARPTFEMLWATFSELERVPRSSVWPYRKAQIAMRVREIPRHQKKAYPFHPYVSTGSPGLPSSFTKFMPKRPLRNWSGIMHTVVSVRMYRTSSCLYGAGSDNVGSTGEHR